MISFAIRMGIKFEQVHQRDVKSTIINGIAGLLGRLPEAPRTCLLEELLQRFMSVI